LPRERWGGRPIPRCRTVDPCRECERFDLELVLALLYDIARVAALRMTATRRFTPSATGSRSPSTWPCSAASHQARSQPADVH
jgi:hypothetical protein